MKFRRLDLNLLVALEALLDECSVTRAADRVHLSQAAMSNALTRLREAMDDEILVRVGRRMVMTDRARAIHPEVREVLRRVETRVMAAPEFDPSAHEREVRCMMSDVMAKTFFAQMSRHFSTQAPLITMASHPVEEPPHLALEQGQIDFLMMPRQYASASHPTIELYREEFDCLLDPDHPLAQGGLDQKAYLAAKHITIELGRGRKTTADRSAIERRYGPLKVGTKVFSQSSVPWMIKGTDWIGTLPRSMAKQYADAIGLARLPLPIEILPNVLVLQWGHFAEQDACMEWVRKQICTFAKSQE